MPLLRFSYNPKNAWSTLRNRQRSVSASAHIEACAHAQAYILNDRFESETRMPNESRADKSALTVRINLSITPEQAAALDERRRQRQDIPGRAEIVREMLALYLSKPDPTGPKGRKNA